MTLLFTKLVVPVVVVVVGIFSSVKTVMAQF